MSWEDLILGLPFLWLVAGAFVVVGSVVQEWWRHRR